MKKDTLFATAATPDRPFEFNQAVVDVFADMIDRSVPIYRQTLEMVGWLGNRVVSDSTRVYDLGCSEGAALLAARSHVNASNVTLVGVDSSAAMLASARRHIDAAGAGPAVELVDGDIADVDVSHASLVILNFTLQFVTPPRRDALLRRIRDGLLPGGALLLSEKIHASAPQVDAVLIERHEDFKRRNAYSELEIARKRASLDNVLIPDTPAELAARLDRAGFGAHGVWLQEHNFLSMLAFR
ncbi:MAG: carboxy-S-adenosyl-L-methionine synthase CmoA [Pseudomonadota bacterium]